MTEHFDFYGFRVELSGDDRADVVEEVTRDFAWFVVPPERRNGHHAAPPDLRILIRPGAPPYAGLPAVPAAVFTPRNVSFRAGDVSYVDYFGRGLAIVNDRGKTCEIYAEDFDLVREIAFLYLLSEVGQYLDATGLHRIHAMGVNYQGHGVLLLLPSGGGKSTMTLQLLRQPGFSLLSEDTPLLDRTGRLHPFPLRLGVREGGHGQIPEEHRHTLRLMEFEPKTFVDLAYFQDRLSPSVDASLLLVGERNLGTESAIVPLSRPRALHSLVKYLVVGLGVYQGLEFLLEEGLWTAAGKTGVAASRLRHSVRLLARVPAYKFVLGRDAAKNARTLIDFLQRNYG